MIQELFDQLSTQSIWEWIALFSGILYVYLAAKNKALCWVFGIISCGIIVVFSFFKYSLYADALLNFFYVIMGVIGLIGWNKKGSEEIPITHIKIKETAIYITGGIIISYLMHLFLAEYTEAAATNLDAFSSVFAVIGTIWLVKRYFENWYLWLLVDAIYLYLYWSRGAWLFLCLFAIYIILSFVGIKHWKKEMQEAATIS